VYLPEFERSLSTNIRIAMKMLPSEERAIEFGYCWPIHLGKYVSLCSSPDFVILHNPYVVTKRTEPSASFAGALGSPSRWTECWRVMSSPSGLRK